MSGWTCPICGERRTNAYVCKNCLREYEPILGPVSEWSKQPWFRALKRITNRSEQYARSERRLLEAVNAVGSDDALRGDTAARGVVIATAQHISTADS